MYLMLAKYDFCGHNFNFLQKPSSSLFLHYYLFCKRSLKQIFRIKKIFKKSDSLNGALFKVSTVAFKTIYYSAFFFGKCVVSMHRNATFLTNTPLLKAVSRTHGNGNRKVGIFFNCFKTVFTLSPNWNRTTET